MKKPKMKLLRETIAKCHDKQGRVRPKLVVEAAQRAKTPGEKLLSSKFNWNVDEAAMEHWLDTAARLIREVKLKVVYDDVTIIAPYYVSDPVSNDRAYLQTTRVAKQDEVAERVLRDELLRIESSIDRSRSLAKIFHLGAHLDRMLAEALQMRRTLDTRPRRDDDDRPRPSA